MAKRKKHGGIGISDQDWSIIHRILESQKFSSIEEAQDFLNKNLTGKTPEELAKLFLTEKTAAQEAQDLVYEARSTAFSLKARGLIRQALEKDPDCVEAFEYKGDMSRTPEDVLKWYEEAMQATVRRMGKTDFEEAKGSFWLVHETRPFMRSKLNSAFTLWELKRKEEAILHLQEMLELNPNDNQGVRYVLMDWLLLEGRLKEAEKLHKEFKDDAYAGWLYDYAVLLFKKEGRGAKANRALKSAAKANPYVLDYLFKGKKLPKKLPGYYSLHSPEEAISYLVNSLPLFEDKALLDWMLKVMA